jgi:hypothetical protein
VLITCAPKNVCLDTRCGFSKRSSTRWSLNHCRSSFFQACGHSS